MDFFRIENQRGIVLFGLDVERKLLCWNVEIEFY